MCVDDFAKFVLYGFFFFDGDKADGSPSCLKFFQLLQRGVVVIRRGELFHFFQECLFQFQVFFLFGVDVFQVFAFYC